MENCTKHSICPFALKSCRAISCVSDELKTNISKIYVYIIRANVMNDHEFLIFLYIYIHTHTHQSKPMLHPTGILHSRWVESNCAVTYLTLTYHHIVTLQHPVALHISDFAFCFVQLRLLFTRNFLR